MTSIRHYKTPHVVKLDGRYKFYPKFKYRIDFNTQSMSDWERWYTVTKWCTATWGDEYIWSVNHTKPTEYRTESSKKNRHFRHLYLRGEQDLTMMLLVIGA